MNNLLILVLQTLYVITIISVVIVIISENRDPVKTVSWVLILAFLPVIGLVWYLFFGQDITKEHVISKRMYSKLKKRPLDEIGATEEFVYPQEHESLIRLLKNLDYTPLLGGNQVTLFTRGEDKFEALLADIARAKEHIHIDYYVFLDDQIGTRIKDALVKKSFFEEMRKAGIEAEPFLKLALPVITSRINYRNHRKVVVIDGRVGYIGGMNIADRYIEGFDWGPWRDTHARIEGKGVQGLQSIFLIDWYFVSQTLITSRKYFPKLDNYGDVLMQTVNSGPLKEEREIVHGILQAIYEAKKSIFIQTPYFIPPEPMTEALQAAAIRGVDVRIMISKRSDVPLVQMASRSFIKRILQAGVKVYLYEKGFLHSKLMMFDDSLTLLGSVNFDSRSFEHNFEVEAFAYDEALASQAKEIFVEDQRYSQSVSLKEWMKRPKIKRFLESLVRLFAPLL